MKTRPTLSGSRSYALALLLIALATAVTLALRPYLQHTPAILILVAVLLSAWYGGAGAGGLASVLCTLIVVYFFIEPAGQVLIANPAHVIGLLVFQAAGLLIVLMTAAGRQSADLYQRRAAQLSALQRLSQAIGRAGSLDQVYAAALENIKTTLEADRASILLADPAGVLRFVAWEGLSKRYRAATEGHSPWPAGAVDPQPVLVPDAEQAPDLAALREVLRAEGIRALAFIPLVDDGRLLGKFMLYYDRPYALNPMAVALAQAIASQLAVAVRRRRDEAAVHAERERLQVTLDSIGDAVITTDLTGAITFLNPVAASLTGWPAQAALGRPIEEVFHIINEATGVAVESPIRRVLREGVIAGLGNRTLLITRGGVTLPIDDSGAPIRDQDGRLMGTVLVFRDISQRRGAERALATHARQQAALAELGQHALAQPALAPLIDEVVKRVAQVLEVEFGKVLELQPDGATLGVIAGVGWEPGTVGQALVLVSPESQASFTLRSSAPVLVDDLPAETRFVGMPLLREHHVISGMTVVIPGARGPYGVLGMHTARPRHFSPDDANFLQGAANIVGAAVERARVEDALRLARDQTKAILAGIAEGVTVQDQTGRLIYANDTAAQMTGYATATALLAAPTGEVMQRFSVFDEAGAPLELSRLPGRQALLGETPASLVVRFRVHASGAEHWSLVSARPVFNASGQVEYAVNIFRDITDLKRTELAQRVLAQAGGVLAHSLDYEVQLAGVAQQVVPHLADWCAVHVRDEQAPAGHRLVALSHADPAKVEQVIAWQQRAVASSLSAVAKVIRSGQAELYADIPAWLQANGLDGERRRLAQSLGLQSAMIVPLSARGRIVGTMTFVWAEAGKHYTAADLAVAEELARRVALTADHARLFQETQQLNAELERRVQARTAELQAINAALEREVTERQQAESWLKASHEQLRALTTRIESVREEERTRIAREVHDELGGALTSLKMDLNRLRRAAAERDDQAMLARVEAMAAVIDQTVNTVRRIATDLRPAVLDDFGLAAAIEWQLQEFGARANVEYALNAAADDLSLDGEAATALFRVFQETLTNVARHAQATRVQVDLEQQASSLVLRVSDNGRGLDPQALNGSKSLGLLGMRERVRLLNGELEIGGAPGQGTSVTVRIPLRPPPGANGGT